MKDMVAESSISIYEVDNETDSAVFSGKLAYLIWNSDKWRNLRPLFLNSLMSLMILMDIFLSSSYTKAIVALSLG